MNLRYLLLTIAISCTIPVFAHTDTLKSTKRTDSQQPVHVDSTKQRDLIDIYNSIFRKETARKHDKPKTLNFSAVPSVGYTLSTGFALDVTANVAFYTSPDHKENLSNIQNDVAYDTKNQILFLNKAEIWSPGNEYHFVSDIKLEKFPTTTYGIGMFTTDADANNIDYYYIRLYPTAYKTVADDFYIGAGLNFDEYFGITESGLLRYWCTGLERLFCKSGRSFLAGVG